MGHYGSVPDATRRRILDVHVFADEIRIFEAGSLIASHAPLEGRDQKRLDPAHRKPLPPPRRRPAEGEPTVIRRAGDLVARRSLESSRRGDCSATPLTEPDMRARIRLFGSICQNSSDSWADTRDRLRSFHKALSEAIRPSNQDGG